MRVLMDYRFRNTLPAAPDAFKFVASVNTFVSMAIWEITDFMVFGQWKKIFFSCSTISEDSHFGLTQVNMKS